MAKYLQIQTDITKFAPENVPDIRFTCGVVKRYHAGLINLSS